jgi:hypothetical protein
MSKRFSTFWGSGRLNVAVAVLEPIPAVKRAPASKNSSNLSEKKFITQLPGAVHFQASRASMKILSVSLFPLHKFDFGDSVFAPSIQQGGTVRGILYREEGVWQYCLSCSPAIWWTEEELQPACPTCCAQWNGASICKHCGFNLNSAT